jgi:hypothetical protein
MSRKGPRSDRLVAVKIPPQAVEERFFALVVVFDRIVQLARGQLARIGERLPKFGLEGAHPLVVLVLGEALKSLVVLRVRIWTAVCRGHPDERGEWPVGVPFPVEAGHSPSLALLVWRSRIHGDHFIPIASAVVAEHEDSCPALKCFHRARRRLPDIRRSLFGGRGDPGFPGCSRFGHAAVDWLKAPACAVPMAIWAEQFPKRQLCRKGLTVRMKRCFQGGAHSRMLNASGESRGKSVGIGNPGRGLTAPMRLITRSEAINSGRTLRRIGLGRIFQIRHPSMVHFLGDPALMSDVTVAAALIERRKDPLHLRRAIGHRREPWSAVLACADRQ